MSKAAGLDGAQSGCPFVWAWNTRTGSLNANALAQDWEIQGVGDFDGDGKADILIRNRDNGQLWLFLMDGASRRAGLNAGGLSMTWAVTALGDYNGDGRTDILLRHNHSGDLWMLLMDGATRIQSSSVGPLDSVWALQP